MDGADEAGIDGLDEHGCVRCRLPLCAALIAHALPLQDIDPEHAYLSGAEVLAGRE